MDAAYRLRLGECSCLPGPEGCLKHARPLPRQLAAQARIAVRQAVSVKSSWAPATPPGVLV